MLLPGETLPAYWAVTGKKTEEAVGKHKEEADKEPAVIISITTGNWIRIRRSTPSCPNPIALGDGHVDMKNKLIQVSDEIYVISPLGKIFYNKRREPLIKGLNLCRHSDEIAAGSFTETFISTDKARHVKLVSTSRSEGRCLHDASITIKENLSVSDPNADPSLVRPVTDYEEWAGDSSFVEAEIGETPHVIFRFDQLPSNKGEEREIEYPNFRILNEEFRKAVDEP